ncbi:MAG: HlyD family efflux transporter periplasmic adaptor subunit [Synergistaceae bacterium]|nr:HlyD family efflux transporter periplasmic adaptor subunit [Synergistaceae bacterium]
MKSTFRKERVFVVIVVLIILGLALYTAMNSEGLKVRSVAFPVRIGVVKTSDVNIDKQLIGKIIPKESLFIYASNEGVIKDFSYKNNDFIDESDRLLTYDDKLINDKKMSLDKLTIDLQAKNADIERLEASYTEVSLFAEQNSILNFENNIESLNSNLRSLYENLSYLQSDYKDEYDRYESKRFLYEADAISRNEFEDSITVLKEIDRRIGDVVNDIESVESDVRYQRKSLEIAKSALDQKAADSQKELQLNEITRERLLYEKERIDLEISELRLFIDSYRLEEVSAHKGVIKEVFVENGDYVTKGQKLIEVINMRNDNFNIEFYIPENQANKISIGQAVTIAGDTLHNEEFTANISSISTIVETRMDDRGNNEDVVKVKAPLPDSVRDIRIGYSVDVHLSVANLRDVKMAPILAILADENGDDFVFIVDENYRISKRLVKTGEFNNLDIVIDGVEVGERYVMNPNKTLKEGDIVEELKN